MIRSVIFDIDNTIYSYDRTSVVADEAVISYALQKGLYPDAEAVRADIREMLEKEAALCPGQAVTHNRMVRFQLMMEKQGKPLVPYAVEMAETYWGALIGEMTEEEGLTDFLRFLKARGIRVGAGSNMTAYVQFLKLKKLGLGPYFDFVVTSEEAGCEKPDRHLFDLCIEKAGCLPKECLFIGDNPKMDAEAAQNAGMQALLYLKNDSSLRAKVPAGMRAFVSYRELKQAWENETMM